MVIKLFILSTLFILSACNSHSNSNQDPVYTSGSAIKGIIEKGIITAYNVSVEPKKLIAKTRTNDNGSFSLVLPEQPQTDIIVFELTTDELTSMRCDLLVGCIEHTSGQLIEFGQAVSLPQHFKLLGTLGKNKSVFISPLSHIILSTAQNLPDGLTSQNIGITSQWLIQTLNLETSPLDTQTADITSLLLTDQASINNIELTEEQLRQGILSASLYNESLSEAWASSPIDLDSLPLEEVLSQSAELAKQLAQQIPPSPENTNTINALTAISSETLAQYVELTTSPLAIQSQPESITIDEGGSFSLYIQASSSELISYQWHKDDQDIPGATSALYIQENAEVSDTATYSVTVSTDSESLNSLYALVIVNKVLTPISIKQQPEPLNLVEGDPIYLSIEISGDGPFTFQWQKGGSIIPGATQESLYIKNSTKADEGSYRITISNSVNTVSSNFVDVWVNTPIAPVEIIKHPENQTAVEESDATFSITAQGGGYITYQWRKDGIAINNAFQNELHISNTSESDIGTYDVLVSNSKGQVSSLSATLSVIPKVVPVSITQQPSNYSIYTGNSVTLSVEVTGDGPLSYQWFLNDAPIEAGTNQSLTINSATDSDQGSYTVTIENSNSNITSSPASLIVNNLPSLVLAWDIPTQREDGSNLTIAEISGYVIAYGTNATDLSMLITINNPLSQSLLLEDLEPGTLYFRISTVDSNQVQGNFSEIISTKLQ